MRIYGTKDESKLYKSLRLNPPGFNFAWRSGHALGNGASM